MAGKSAAFENDLLKLIFNGAGNNIANIADNAASSPLTNLYVALHTADPTDAGNQTSSEATVGAYNTYARVPVARTTGGWTVAGSAVTPVANIDFAGCTGGSGCIATHWSVGVASSGATKILYSGTVTPNITIANGVTPRLTTATNINEG